MIFRLAVKNLFHAGLRTWLNISALTLVFIMILFVQGLYSGMFNQIEDNMIRYEVAGGQYWQADFDPNNPLKLDDSHASYITFESEIKKGNAVPILYRSGAMYTENGVRGVLIKGIDKDQSLLKVPTTSLNNKNGYMSAYIGKNMAEQAGLTEGDEVLLRFRDKNGMNNAIDVSIDSIVHFPIQSIDIGQIWVDLNTLQTYSELENEATVIVVNKEFDIKDPQWVYQGMDVMFADLSAWRAQEMTGGYVMMGIFLGLAMLAIFDTQILSIFRRKKEIGTLVAVGMRQQEVVALFTLEGMILGLISILAGSTVGIPLLLYFNNKGMVLGKSMEDLGMNIMSVLYPECSWDVIGQVSMAVMIIVILVSFLASRRIAKMNIVQILKGK